MSHDQEILGPALRSKQEARPLIKQAAQHFKTARRATIQVMADLRRLQDGQVHTLYGYKNFGQWAADTFPGLAVGNVRQLCRAGAVALELDRRGLIDLNDPQGVGTTGLRELSTISGTYGDDKMAEIFKTAKDMIEPGEWVSGNNVEAALRLLMPPAEPVNPKDESEREQLERIADEYQEDERPQTEAQTKEQELIDHIRDLSFDLPDSLAEISHAVEQLANERSAQEPSKDQTWIEGTR